MKIRKLHLKNIGVFDDEEIEFKECDFNKGKEIKDRKAEIHILTGENGTGKTTILQGLATGFSNSIDLIKKKIRFSNNEDIKCVINFDNNESTEYLNTVILPSPWREPSFNYPISIRDYITFLGFPVGFFHNSLSFAAFAYSGYRRIIDKPIEIGKEIKESPLFTSLDFIKNEDSSFTINQWLGENLLNKSLAETRNKHEEATKLKDKIEQFENVINEIIKDETKENKIKFEMQSATKLVLIKNNKELDFDVLPDGLKSLISWIGDLLMRLDSLNWKDDTPIFEREIILFLDEIEVHLHPAWQRKVLPVVQKLFKNAQIFVSTHSPFVVNSVDDAWVYKLKVDENGKAKVASVERSEDGKSYSYVLEETFDIKEEFGIEAEKELDEFYQLRNSILSNGSSEKDIKKITKLAKDIAKQSEELNTIIQIEIRQINRKKGLNLKV